MSNNPSEVGNTCDTSNTSKALLLLERDTASIAAARDWVGDFLLQHGIDGSSCDDAALVVSELVTNALRHGIGDVVVRASIGDRSALQIAVTDAGDGTPEIQPMDPLRVGGVGLRIVDDVAQRWGVAQFPGGTTVWAIVPLHA